MNVEIVRQNIIILFWKYRDQAVSFLGVHKSEPDIYTGFSPALYLQRMLQTSSADSQLSRRQGNTKEKNNGYFVFK